MLGEDLDSVPLAGGFLHAEVHLGEVTLAQLLQQGVLLEESAGLSAVRVPEDEAGFPVDGNLIAVLQLAALVAAYVCLVDKCPVLGQVLQDSDGVAALVLGKDEAVAIRDYVIGDDNVCMSRVSKPRVIAPRVKG
jgi:hypothetical protein